MPICPACLTPNPDRVTACSSCRVLFTEDAGSRENKTQLRQSQLTIAEVFTEPVNVDSPGGSATGSGAAAAQRAFQIGLHPGDVIADRYEIGVSLGEGGMGRVYKAFDRELEHDVALKTIRPDLACRASVLHRFKQEILLAREISHRNVIRAFDLGVHGPLRFITMEFFDGEDLCAYLDRRNQLMPEELVPIASQICDGLSAAHREGVVHRDLKPQNILINTAGEIRILDFGLARSFQSPVGSQTGLAVGTPDYMSPEQACGQQASPQSDLYALGLICYEMLTGDLPFKGETAMARLMQRSRQCPVPPRLLCPQIPEYLNRIVMRCLEIDPAQRTQSAEELGRELCRSGEPVTLSAIPIRAQMTRAPRWAIVLAAALILVCLSAIGILVWRRSSSSFNSGLSPAAANLSTSAEAMNLYAEASRLLHRRSGEKDTETAVQKFTQVTAKDPNYALGWAGIADAKLELYRLNHEGTLIDQAQMAVNQARKLSPSLPEVQRATASVYEQRGENAEAVTELLTVLKSEPKSDDTHLRLAKAYLNLGQSERAIGEFKQAIKYNEYYWFNHDQLAKAYFKLGRNEEALKQFERVIELNPSDPAVFRSIGDIHFRQSRWPQCIAEYQKALKLKPSVSIYTNLGTAFFYLGRYPEAISQFQSAIQMNKNRPRGYINLAEAYRQLKQWENVQATYDRAIEVAYEQLQTNPQDPTNLGFLAISYARKGGHDGVEKGRNLITQAREIDNRDNQLMYFQAEIAALGGRKQEAVEALREALKHGYSAEEARRDPDLASLRSDPGFQAALE